MMSKTSVISVRIPHNTRKMLDKYSEILRIRPSALCALVLEDCLEYWIKKYSEEALKKIWEIS